MDTPPCLYHGYAFDSHYMTQLANTFYVGAQREAVYDVATDEFELFCSCFFFNIMYDVQKSGPSPTSPNGSTVHE